MIRRNAPRGLSALAAALFFMIAGLAAAQARSVQDIVTETAATGRYAEGLAALAVLPAGAEPAERAFAEGMFRFAGGMERFAQALYRHGFNPGRRSLGPLLGLQLPAGSPNPQPIDYPTLRGHFDALGADMAAAALALEKAGEAPVKLRLDLSRIRIDIDANGVAGEDERLFSLVRGTIGDWGDPSEPRVIAFDAADVHWLRGYATLTGAFVDLWLAHDFSETFRLSFQLLFAGNVDSPEAKRLASAPSRVQGMDAADIADTIAFIHLIRWPLAEPARVGSARLKLVEVIRLNRVTWRLARAETDDDGEWLPNPRQKPAALPGFAITDERIDAWLAALAESEDVLEGRKLLPHWRFTLEPTADGMDSVAPPVPGAGLLLGLITGGQRLGVNLRKAMDEPRTFDLVLWFTGQAALPYLEPGVVADGAAWGNANLMFEGNLLPYAFWFN
jgi:hypothetical protein